MALARRSYLLESPYPQWALRNLDLSPRVQAQPLAPGSLTPQVPGALFNLEVNGNMKLKSLSESK